MYSVEKVVTYNVRDNKTYLRVAQELVDELVAQKIAAVLNEQEVKYNAEISKLSQPVDVSAFTLPNS